MRSLEDAAGYALGVENFMESNVCLSEGLRWQDQFQIRCTYNTNGIKAVRKAEQVCTRSALQPPLPFKNWKIALIGIPMSAESSLYGCHASKVWLQNTRYQDAAILELVIFHQSNY